MASRRDQLQSHQFLTQRVISAFVMRETDPAQSPLRRGVGAVFAGVMIAVMVGAGFGIYGLLTKVGSSNWKTDGAVIIEKETGAPFVYQGGQLHPMLNYASALLVTGSSTRAVFKEPADALSGVPRGVMLGIPYAPDSVSDAAHTIGAPWTLCSADTADGSGSSRLTTTLTLSTAPSGAQPLGDQGLLLRDPSTKATYLVWHGARYGLATSVLPALFGVVTPVPTGTAWLNSLPRGADIAPLTIPDAGTRSPAAHKYDIGDVLVTQVGTGGVQYWMVLSDGLAPITELQKDIAVSQGAAGPKQITSLAANAIAPSTQLHADDAVAQPAAPPKLAPLANAGERICAVFPAAANAPTVTLGGAVAGTGTPTGSRTSSGAVLADRVMVPAGHAAVVRVMASTTSMAGGYYLVTDLGIRYAVASDDVLKMLGYQPSDAISMPANLVQLIPVGPALDPAAAGTPATGAISGG